MNSRNLTTLEGGASSGQIWRAGPHSINFEISHSRVEIVISCLILYYMTVFLIRRTKFIGNCWKM
jgi:hypothetical protein